MPDEGLADGEQQEPTAEFAGGDVVVKLAGGYQAVLDGDPPWSFMEYLAKMGTSDADGSAAMAGMAELLPTVVRSWTLPAKVAGQRILPGQDPLVESLPEKPLADSTKVTHTEAWAAGDVPPVCAEGVRTISTRLLVEMLFGFGNAFKLLPKAAAG